MTATRQNRSSETTYLRTSEIYFTRRMYHLLSLRVAFTGKVRWYYPLRFWFWGHDNGDECISHAVS